MNFDSAHKKKLYAFIFPDRDICSELKLYFNISDPDAYSFDTQRISLGAGNTVDTLTYFNSFSSYKWKKYTNVSEIAFCIKLKGMGKIEFLSLKENEIFTLEEWQFDYPKEQNFTSPLFSLNINGFLGIRISAFKNCEIIGGEYFTDMPALRTIHLALCIGTYRRESLIQKTTAKLNNYISNTSSERFDIIIVDNASSLDPASLPGSTCIPSRNFGGTGAFMRALLYCEEKGTYTHCLFMDDDATCEAGSIYRSIAFISHALEGNQALAGAMLCNDPPWRLWENGAFFDGAYHPLSRDLDLRESASLLQIEQESKNKIYGAWWFFFFPLEVVVNYAFPFFVHGDDVDFSYMNNFRITTLNGVCAWHEDFRNRPASHGIYFSIRSSLVYCLSGIGGNSDFNQARSFLERTFKNYNDAYFYGSAACVNLAIEHVLSGIEFWDKNLDMEKILPILAKLGEKEILRPSSMSSKPCVPMELRKNGYWSQRLRKLSFNGHLLPSGFMRASEKEYIPRSCSPSPARTFLRVKPQIMDKKGRQVTLKKQVSKYFYNMLRFKLLLWRLKRQWLKLAREYDETSRQLRSRSSWQARFAINKSKSGLNDN